MIIFIPSCFNNKRYYYNFPELNKELFYISTFHYSFVLLMLLVIFEVKNMVRSLFSIYIKKLFIRIWYSCIISMNDNFNEFNRPYKF
jgi:uncharacterized membrane protein